MSDHSRLRVRGVGSELLAGAGIGLLVGVLIGLSVSQVVGTVVAALTALVAAFLGLSADAKPESARLGRIAAFAFLSIVGLVLGITLRTHDSLSKSIGDRVDDWVTAGYAEDSARQLVVYERTGLIPPGWSKEADSKASARGSTVLFGTSADQCAQLDPESFADTKELANAFRLAGGPWAEIAELTDGTTQKHREILVAAWRLTCGSA